MQDLEENFISKNFRRTTVRQSGGGTAGGGGAELQRLRRRLSSVTVSERETIHYSSFSLFLNSVVRWEPLYQCFKTIFN